MQIPHGSLSSPLTTHTHTHAGPGGEGIPFYTGGNNLYIKCELEGAENKVQ